MSAKRVFAEPLPEAAPGTDFAPEPRIARYLFDVLRARAGERFLLFDRRRELLVEARRDRTLAAVESRAVTREARPETLLLLPLMKGERLKDALRMAVEVGVDRVLPVALERSVRELARPEKLAALLATAAGQAAQQCGVPPPEIEPPEEGIAAGIRGAESFEIKVFFSPEAPRYLDELPRPDAPPRSVALATGPEGGLSPAETAALSAAGFVPARLRANILRCETAVPVCLALLRQHYRY